MQKLNETRFFCKKLRDAESDATLNQSDEFAYYLSAFLSAARSVTLVLQVEKKDEYDNWFPPWRDSLSEEDRELLVFMNAQRIESVHRKGAFLDSDLHFVPVSLESFNQERGHPAYGIHWFGPPSVGEVKIGRARHFFQDADPPGYVVETCERYLRLLDDAMRAFMVHIT